MLWKNFKHYQKKKNESGQALTEFLLGLMIVISFFFFYVKMAAVLAIGNYIHYATFMAARAYVSSAGSEEIQRTSAESVLKAMIGTRYRAVAPGMECESGCPQNSANGTVGGRIGGGPYFQDSAEKNRWNQGVTYSYKAKLSLFPFSRENESLTMKLTSESWFPREESEEETKEARGKIASLLSSKGQGIQVEWDNGY